jgi:hypothetical protein
MDPSGHQGQTLEIVPISPSHLETLKFDELDRDAQRRAGTHKGWISCPFLIVGLHMNWGSLVRRTAIIIGAAFVAGAIVYLVAKLVILVLSSGIT